jgi:hypothetical protein
MNKIKWSLILVIALTACKVTFISGYDLVIDQTATKIQSDFNAFWFKLSRTIQDSDSANQKFENFQDYYDHLEADLLTLTKRASFLPPKSNTVQQQIINVDSTMHAFITFHKQGIPDRQGDDRHDKRDAVNASLDGLIKLQEALKNSK